MDPEIINNLIELESLISMNLSLNNKKSLTIIKTLINEIELKKPKEDLYKVQYKKKEKAKDFSKNNLNQIINQSKKMKIKDLNAKMLPNLKDNYDKDFHNDKNNSN